MRTIGEWYLGLHPEERSRAELLQLLSRTVPGAEDFKQHGCSTSVEEQVRNACRADYERNDTVYLDGWLFARTELRLCALAAV